MEPITVLVVDDHPLVRRGVVESLKEEPEISVVGEAADGAEAVDKARQLSPQVIIMDLQMPRMSGLEAIQALQGDLPQSNILVLTVSEKEQDLFTAIRAGARGYLLKDTTPQELVRGVQHIAQGGVLVSPAMASKLLGELARVPQPVAEANLSQREVEVLQLVAQGASNREIAAALIIAENTVKTHLRHILDKLQLANRSQVAAYAARSQPPQARD